MAGGQKKTFLKSVLNDIANVVPLYSDILRVGLDLSSRLSSLASQISSDTACNQVWMDYRATTDLPSIWGIRYEMLVSEVFFIFCFTDFVPPATYTGMDIHSAIINAFLEMGINQTRSNTQ